MTKQQAISFFGSGAALSRALGMTRQAVDRWPDVLTQRLEDRMVGAMVRMGMVNEFTQPARHESGGTN